MFTKIDYSSSVRLSLNYCCSILNYQSESFNKNDPIFTLLKSFDDIIRIINGNKVTKISKYLYFNKKLIHNILYESNEVLKINFNNKKNNLEFFFYLILLIRENPNIYDYDFDREYITELNDENRRNNENKINKVIKAKLIYELSNEYLLDSEENKDEKELEEIVKENYEIISDQNNMSIFNEINDKINVNDIIEMSIDELYSQIIIGLIESKKFENFDYVYDVIIIQLNLDEIDITQLMYDNIKNFLDNEENKNISNDYLIKEENDLDNECKVNFNFILIKYILKNIYNIYDIKYISNIKQNLKIIFDKNKNALQNIEKNKYTKIKDILDLLSLQPKKHLKNNLKNYYNKFLPNVYKNKRNDKKENEKDNKLINHGDLYIIDYINQIFEVNEFRDEYKNIINTEEKVDFTSFMEQLANYNPKYKDKLNNIFQNETLKKAFRDGKKVDKKLLNDLFIFLSLEEDQDLNKIENEMAKLDEGKELKYDEETINKILDDVIDSNNNEDNGDNEDEINN